MYHVQSVEVGHASRACASIINNSCLRLFCQLFLGSKKSAVLILHELILFCVRMP